ncbi:hypothetical protein TGAM01_v210317 [Trichoderma gamsii]|uniref:DNA2/NAM7 helicase-like C-terminal domain-containing protein n=1 Tax=Trichoderma gamsii TaxID=398673 RepID=A0A2P4Z921_9HYPO|nr:hypothetical protein TGAM01_v210317 [Trichoderma gamsii]PON20809.1 hypothetical protein TGAM01_v210317 [Trichoderma gamsii]
MAQSANDDQNLAGPSTPPAAQPPVNKGQQAWRRPAAIALGSLGIWPARTESKYIYFSIGIPLGADNDDLGYGQVHCYKRETFRREPTPVLELRVRFPIGRFTGNPLDEMPERLQGQFPNDDFRALEISLHDGVFVEVDGFGLPFHNPGHDADDWINKGSVVADSMTFVDILRQRKWHIIIKQPYKYFGRLWEETMVPAPFTFRYGNEHWFDLARYETQFKDAAVQGPQFLLSVNFPDVSSMQAVVTQSAVQHHLMIAIEVAKIFAKKLPVFFIPSRQNLYFAIVLMEGPYCQTTEKIWSEITKQSFFRLALHEDKSPMDTPNLTEHKQWHKQAAFICDARIVDKTEAKFIPELKDYPLTSLDLVLLVQRPEDFKVSKGVQKSIGDGLAWLRIKTFPTDLESWNTVSLLFDPQLDDLERKIKAVTQYSLSPVTLLPENGPKMITHTVFQLGRGFLNRLNRAGTWDLPMINILDLDSRLLDCLMEEILEEDRGRFRHYMGHLSVGAPGSGKTTTLGVATLGMAHTLGKVFVSAPTLATVDSFSRRLDILDRRVVARHNKSLTKNGSHMPIRRKLVVRGLSMKDEIEALHSLLQRSADNGEASEAAFQDMTNGLSYLSAAYWLLKVLGSPAVPSCRGQQTVGACVLQGQFMASLSFAQPSPPESDCERWEEAHRNGVKLEAFLKQRFPNLPSPAENTMEPVFVHCTNSQSNCDSATGSMSNLGQCEVALQLLVDLVNDAKIDPAQLGVITPYKANVGIMERWIQEKPEFSVLRCVAPATAESYQGREADIVCVVMGTTRYSGPGLTRDEDCLKSMLSRHRSGLIIVGDFKLAGFDVKKTKWWLTGKRKGKSKGKSKGKDEGQPDFGSKMKYLKGGEAQSVKAETLRRVYWWFQSRGRKVEIAVPEEGGYNEACDEDQDAKSDS